MNSTPELDADESVPTETDLTVAETETAPDSPDERLLAAHDLALAALYEITPSASVGEPIGYTLEADGVVSLRFETTLSGYPGWFWTVSLARVEGDEPTVLEVELLPGETALLAPEWVPWAVRLAEYRAQQAAVAGGDESDREHAHDDERDDEAESDDLDEGADDDDDLDDLDAVDFDLDGSPILHSGDLDGVDIDELDESASAESSDD